MTCAEPTLFLGTSVVAANALPPSAIERARQAMTPAGVGRNCRMDLPFLWVGFLPETTAFVWALSHSDPFAQ
jgi:hypothetical protein